MNKKYLIVAPVLVALLLTAIFICRKTEPVYKQTITEALVDLAKGEGIVEPLEAVQLSQAQGETNHVFIDIRTPYDYVKGHIEGAVSLPATSILTADAQQYFDKMYNAKITAIIYGDSQNQANTPWLVLKQLGYDNIRILAGGYPIFKAFLAKDSTAMANYKPVETALLDFKAAIKADTSQILVSKPKPKKEVKLVPVVKKQEAAEGGC
jgi:rhodanese-related sulfurtransferase